jgi:hypothetical protein
LLAILGAAERGEGRRGALCELAQAVFCRGSYQDSREELTPVHHDLRAGLPVAAVAIAVSIQPKWWRWFASGAVGNYALTPAAWKLICDGAP